MNPKPVIGLTADSRLLEPHTYHVVGDKYVRAVAEAAEGIPMLLPALMDASSAEDILHNLDGLVLTGAYSNIEAHHYGGDESDKDSLGDPARDAVNLRIIPLAIAAEVPIFGICRGFQEMNVALGGSLYQQVHEVEGLMYHLENKDDPLDKQYDVSHEVQLRKGGYLATLTDKAVEMVNSLHGQGVNTLAENVTVEATAPDGLVEAFTVNDAKQFTLAVQWHPEWKFNEHPFYLALWRAFGMACRQRAKKRQR
jgi:putative glutamine amidotransferase